MNNNNRLYFALMAKPDKKFTDPVFLKDLNPKNFTDMEIEYIHTHISINTGTRFGSSETTDKMNEPGIYIYVYDVVKKEFSVYRFDANLDAEKLFGEYINDVSTNIFNFLGVLETPIHEVIDELTATSTLPETTKKKTRRGNRGRGYTKSVEATGAYVNQ